MRHSGSLLSNVLIPLQFTYSKYASEIMIANKAGKNYAITVPI